MLKNPAETIHLAVATQCFGTVLTWCRANLAGHEALSPGLDGGDWYLAITRRPTANPLDMGTRAYGLAITTRNPDDHLLVQLTWG